MQNHQKHNNQLKNYWMIIRGKIAHKKTESLLIGCSILVSVLAFCVSFGLLSSVDKPYDTMISEANGAHLLVFYDTRVHDQDEVVAWFKAREEVSELAPNLSTFNARGEFLVGERKVERSLLLAERAPGAPSMDRLTIVSSLDPSATQPKIGEVWIPNRLAEGQEIKLGDTLGITADNGLQSFVVSALVVDPHFSTEAISPTRCWVAPGQLALNFPLQQLTRCYLGVRLHHPEAAAKLNEIFIKSQGGELAGFSMDHSMLKLAHGIFLRILAVALLVVALLAQLIAVFTVSATINSDIRADYRTIGIYKALGFTPGQVKRLFVMRYLVLAVLFVPLGALAGVAITKLFLNSLLKAVGLVNLSLSLAVPALASAVLVTLMIALIAWWSSRAAGAIKPMQAIRFGAPPQTARRKLSALAPFGRLPLPLVLGMRNLFLNTRRTVLFAVGMAFTVGVLVFSVNIVHSFGEVGKNPALFGDTNTPVTVSLSGGRFSIEPEQFNKVLDNHKAVTSRIAYGNVSALVPDRSDKSGRQIRGTAFDGDMEQAGLLNLQGRHPRADDEIAIGINTAKIDRLALGDKTELFIEGFPITFTVTGIYQTGMNFGDGFRIRANAIRAMNTTWEVRTFGIHLAEGLGVESFKAEMKERFHESVSVNTLLERSDELERQLASMNRALIAFCTILLVISFVSIFNDTMLSLQEQTKTMGIFKAMGLTPKQIRATLAGKAVAGAGLGLLLGMPVSLLGIPLALNLLFSKLGLVDFPFSINIPGTLLIIPGLLIFAYICAWLPARRVSGLRVRNLIHA